MRQLFVFMMVSLDGYFEGPNHDLSWHRVDAEFNDFAIPQTKNTGTLVFGRRTYELMADYWPTAQATDDPVVAKLMNEAEKVVFSHSLAKVDWQNTRLATGDLATEITRLKQALGKDIGLYGSNQLMVRLLELGLLDELRIMINPVIIGAGTRLFAGLSKSQDLNLIETRRFKSGNVLLSYRPQP